MSTTVVSTPHLTITTVSPTPNASTNHGQSLPEGTTISTVTVKQERHDEAEIQELAAKMVEAQKAAMAKQANQQLQQIGGRQLTNNQNIPPSITGQANILNYLTRKTPQPTIGTINSINSTSGNLGINSVMVPNNINGQIPNNINNKATNPNNTAESPDKKTCDEESQKGHFGWATFGKIYIPYIVRQAEKYCAVRMVEMKLLNKYLSYLHPDIYSSCTCVRSYYITEPESRLLNEINHKHCDAQYGRELFTVKDLVVRLTDATKFYQFLDICYRKLLAGSKSPSDKCGFIRINKESVVPYTVRTGEQVVPLFYFEGETENLRQKADYLSGWDLAYLKFCCKVQGIRNELFSSESVAVISLTDIKSYFPTGTEFEDYWPSKVVDTNLLIASKNPSSSIHWTRQPTAPPPKVLNPGTNQQKSGQQPARKSPYPPVQNTNAAQRMMAGAIQSSQGGITNTVQALTNGWSLAAQAQAQAQSNLPPMLTHAQNEQVYRIAQALNQQQNQRSYGTNRNQIPTMMPGRQYNYNNGMPISSMNCTQSQQPPPLVRSASQNQNHMLNCASSLPNMQRSNSCHPDFPINNQHHLPLRPQSYQINNNINYQVSNNNNNNNLDVSAFNTVLNNNSLRNGFQNKQQHSIKTTAGLSSHDACEDYTKTRPNHGGGVANSFNNHNFITNNSNPNDTINDGRLQHVQFVFDKLNENEKTVVKAPVYALFTALVGPKLSKNISSPQVPNNNKIVDDRLLPPITCPVSVIRSTSTIPSNLNHTSSATTPSSTTPSTLEVIDLSIPRRSTVAAANAALHQHQQQQQQQQRMVGNPMQNGRNNQTNVPNNSAAMHLQRHAASAAVVAASQQNFDARLSIIPEIPSGSVHIPPYKVQKVFVFENTMVPCINMKAYNDSDQLMTLTDFREFFFPNVPLDNCKRFIEALGVVMYKGNRRQIQTLIESGKPHSENIPLIQVRDVIKYMPQLRYMMRSQEQPPNKRTRIS